VDWSNEEYVRVYTRETSDDIELSWQALALWRTLLTKFDRAGLLPVRNGWASVARIIRWPTDVVESAGPELVRDGRARMVSTGLFAPNYVAAQTATKSDKLRQRESRDRRRDVAAAMQDVDTAAPATEPVTIRDQTSRAGHEPSRDVTLCSALLCDPSAEPEAMRFPPDEPAASKSPPLELEAPRKVGRATKPRRPRPDRPPEVPLPSDWQPRKHERDKAVELGLDPVFEAGQFRNNAISKAKTFVDWDAAFRTWLGNALRFGGGARSPPASARVEPADPSTYPTGDLRL
jgi:hypothetical protein